MRVRIYQVIELSKDNDRLSLFYDWFLLFTIIISIFPLTVKSPGMTGVWIDSITAVKNISAATDFTGISGI